MSWNWLHPKHNNWYHCVEQRCLLFQEILFSMFLRSSFQDKNIELMPAEFKWQNHVLVVSIPRKPYRTQFGIFIYSFYKMPRLILFVTGHKTIAIQPYKSHTHEYQSYINVMLNPLAKLNDFKHEPQSKQPKSKKCHLHWMNTFRYQTAKLWNKLHFSWN